jgi:CheY-like chemotaxis protein
MPQHGAPARILVVDDDQAVRDFACEALSQQGHAVLAARDGVEALEILEKEAAAIDLMVTDVVMPGLNGFSLASVVKGRWPEIRILYVTGFYELAQAEMGERFGNVLQKPFRARQLASEVGKALVA